jgi:TonB family protein
MHPVSSSTTSEPGVSSVFSTQVRETIRAAADVGLKSLPRRGVEIGGLLTTSSPHGSAPFIDHAELITTEHRFGPGYRLSPQDAGVLRSRADEIRARKGTRIVGYFRSCTADAFTFAPNDLDVLRDELPECRLLLIVKPFPDGHATARVFQPHGGSWSQTDEFKLTRATPVAPASNSEPAPPIRTSPPPVLPHERSLTRRILIYTAVLLFVALTGAAAWLRSRPTEAAGLGVTVEPAGDLLRLTWKRDTSAVRSATAGVLRIEDGAGHQDIILDTQQLSSGSILYRPSSRDVTFRLEIRGARRTAGETVRVVSGVGPASPEPVQTAAPPAPVTALQPQSARRAGRKRSVLENSPSLEHDPAPKAKPEQQPAAPAGVGLKPAVPVETPRQPASMAAAPVPSTNPPPAYQRPWEPIPSVMHYLNDPAVTPPRPILKVMPKITGPLISPTTEIRILVAVNPKGGVAGAELLDPPANTDPDLVKRAMAAARHWKFEPALDHGKRVSATYTVTFRFRPPDQ